MARSILRRFTTREIGKREIGRPWALFCLALVVATVPGLGCRRHSADPAQKAPPPADPNSPHRGGLVRLPSNEPRYLNPILETRFDLANTLIFEGLLGVDVRNEPSPRLAQSYKVSPDGLSITFRIRDGALWHDGQKVTSHDVAFTFAAVRASTKATSWKSYMEPVAKLETPDDQTVVVTYKEPFAPALATWTMPIVPAHIYGIRAGNDYVPGEMVSSEGNREAVGSGPFKLTRWENGTRMFLAANDKWWFGRPFVDNLELVFNVGEADVLGKLKRAELDWAPIETPDDILALEQNPELHDQFEETDSIESRIRLIAWNTQRGLLADKRVRQALTFALNRDRVIEDVLDGQARTLSGPFFPTMFGADPSIPPPPFDLARAKTLLDAAAPVGQANASGGKPVPGQRFAIEIIAVDSVLGPVTDAAFGIFRHDLETLGVSIKLTKLSPREYFNRIARRDFDAALFGWLPDIPDPDPYSLLHSSQIIDGANYAGLRDAQVDALVDQARHVISKDSRKALYARVHALLNDLMPYTPLYSPYGHYAWSRRLHGVAAHDLDAQPPLPGIGRWWVSSNAADAAGTGKAK